MASIMLPNELFSRLSVIFVFSAKALPLVVAVELDGNSVHCSKLSQHLQESNVQATRSRDGHDA